MGKGFVINKSVRVKSAIYTLLTHAAEESETTQPSALARQLIVARLKNKDLATLQPLVDVEREKDPNSHRISIRLSEANMRDVVVALDTLRCPFSHLVNAILEEELSQAFQNNIEP